MDTKTLIAKVRAINSRNDLFNLLNEIKADLLGNNVYPFTRKQFLILCNPNNEKSVTIHLKFPRNPAGLGKFVPRVGI